MGLASGLNAVVTGPAGAPVLVFLHGFLCGQAMWRHVVPAFEGEYQVLLLDLPCSGDADPVTYDAERHASLQGYADDVLRVLDELGLDDVTIVGHSVSSMIAVLAHVASPSTVSRLVLVAPSARYVDEGDYRGGFTTSEIEELLGVMERNHLGWQGPLSGLVAGEGHDASRAELEDSFCRARPEIAAQFAAVTFRGDNRSDLQRVTAPTLVLQVRDDAIAPLTAGQFVHQHITGSQLQVLETFGHSPHLSDPGDVVAAIRGFLSVPVPS
ncbi:MAG: alpha/beta hydrolase [Nocardioides sp.]